MQAPRSQSRLVREQPGFRGRAGREGLERKLDAEAPADGVDLQDLVGCWLIGVEQHLGFPAPFERDATQLRILSAGTMIVILTIPALARRPT